MLYFASFALSLPASVPDVGSSCVGERQAAATPQTPKWSLQMYVHHSDGDENWNQCTKLYLHFTVSYSGLLKNWWCRRLPWTHASTDTAGSGTNWANSHDYKSISIIWNFHILKLWLTLTCLIISSIYIYILISTNNTFISICTGFAPSGPKNLPDFLEHLSSPSVILTSRKRRDGGVWSDWSRIRR